jgi:hypothetical protein
VIRDVPGATTVAVVPDREMTEVVSDAYVNVPGVEGVGSVKVKFASPVFFETLDQVKVGVTLT